MDNPYGYTVTLALEDFLPVLLSGLGCFWLVRRAAMSVPQVRFPAYAGVVLVVLGGLCKAGWKLTVASGGPDLERVQQGLFPFLAFGFTLIAWSAWSGFRGRLLTWWPFAALLAVSTVAAVALRDTFPLFVLAVLASLTVTAIGIAFARRTDDNLAIAGFVLQVVGVFGLVPLEGIEEQTLSLQWTEQSINTLAQGAFALACWRVLHRRDRETPAVSRDPVEAAA